jgi:hypothetical protein
MYICTLKSNVTQDKVEPPSHIMTCHAGAADPMSDDPLSESILIVVSDASCDAAGAKYSVCTYNVRTGLSYIGTSGNIDS